MTPYNPTKIIYFANLGKIHVTFLYFLPWKINNNNNNNNNNNMVGIVGVYISNYKLESMIIYINK
jgi:hypothetical protein